MKDINFINPIPPKKQEELIRWLIVLLTGSCFLIIILSSITVYQVYMLINLRQKKQALQTTSIQVQKIKEKKSQLEQSQNSLKEKIKKIERFSTNPKKTIQLLQKLSALIPSDVALLHYRQTNKSLELEGLALQTNSILNFLQELNHSNYFKNMQIHAMQQQEKNLDKESLVRFTIKGKI